MWLKKEIVKGQQMCLLKVYIMCVCGIVCQFKVAKVAITEAGPDINTYALPPISHG